MRLAIETNRLRLRLPVPADAPALARQIGVWEVASVLAKVPYPYTPEMAHDWLNVQAQARRAGQGVAFAIVLPDTPKDLIGVVSLNDRQGEEAELGYWLAANYWGKGIMSEAARATAAFGFDIWGLSQISSGHFDENPNSGRVLAKLGFAVTGTGPIPCAARNNARLPHTYMRLKAEDWWRGPSDATSL